MREREVSGSNRKKSQEESSLTFTHPKFLPNTKFISKKPTPILQDFRAMLDRFYERYGYTDITLGDKFRNSKDAVRNIFKDDIDSNVSTVQYIINDMHTYDKHYEKRIKRRLYKAKVPFDIVDNFSLKFDLFCARHQINSTVGSNWAFGSPSIFKMYKDKKISPRIKVIDSVLLQMYEIDKEHVKKMGDIYKKWKKYGQ